MQRNRKRSDVGSNVEDNRVGLLVSKSSRKYKYGMFSSSLYCFFLKKKEEEDARFKKGLPVYNAPERFLRSVARV